MSKILSTLMTIVVMTTAIVGMMVGTMMPQNTRHSLAPSTRAASSISTGTPLSEADSMVMQKPVHIHTPTAIKATVLICGSESHETGWPPSATTMALSNPICVAPEL